MIGNLRIDSDMLQILDKSVIFCKSADIHLIGSPYAANTPREPWEWSPGAFPNKFMRSFRLFPQNIDFLLKILRNPRDS